MSATTMPVGKYRGDRLDRLPLQYLEWLVEQDFLREPPAGKIRLEYDRRIYSQSSGLIVNPEIVDELVSAGVRTLTKRYHPDCGGDHARMTAVNQAAEWLRSQAREVCREN
jgi:hypothetical protein